MDELTVAFETKFHRVPKEEVSSTFSRAEIAAAISSEVTKVLNSILPEAVEKKETLRLIRRYANFTRNLLTSDEKKTLTVETAPENAEALEGYSTEEKILALSDEDFKAMLKEVYGQAPRGRFDRDKWNNKVVKDFHELM